MKKLLIPFAGAILMSAAYAQVEPAAKESAAAVAEGSKEMGDQAKSAFQSGPEKGVTKAKAKLHKAKAKYHRKRAKAAADAAVH